MRALINRHSPLTHSNIRLSRFGIIAAILATIALPAYRDHTLRARVTEALSQLSATNLRLEQFYQDSRNFGSKTVCGVPMPTNGNFSFECSLGANGQSYVLTASGVATSSTQAFSFTIDQSGNMRTLALPADWGTTPVNCWIARKGMAC